MKKNVLEVVLEKDKKGSFSVTESECVHFMQKLGIMSKGHVDAYKAKV